MTESLSIELVLVDGNIDQTASLAAFETALVRRATEREIERTGIAEAVSELFDENLGKSIPMPTVASMVCAKLNVPAESHNVISERVLDYIRAQDQGKVVEGVAERPDSLFVVAKGKGGGCGRRADLPVKPAKASKKAAPSASLWVVA